MAVQQATRDRQMRAGDGAGYPLRSRGQGNQEYGSAAMNMGNGQLAKALGLFSIGLGLAQVAAPSSFAQLIGASGNDDSTTLVRLVGLRELACGVGILAQPDRPVWLWARVGGDMMDLALLASALKSSGTDNSRLSMAAAAVLGVTALDLLSSQQTSRHAGAGSSMMNVTKAITIKRPPEELYQFWRNFQNLPRFMNHLESVQVTGDRTSHWRTKGPAGSTVEWDAIITEERPNQLIAWRSTERADVDNAGVVHFAPAPGGRGTEVRVEMQYNPPGGPIGAIVAKLFGEAPEQQVYDDLRALKQILETGEVVQSDASIHRSMHPAQPPASQARR
jgi:uncharacterized membrane protein